MLPSYIYCTYCGAKNQAQSAFCDACGDSLQVGTSSLQSSGAGVAIGTLTSLLSPNHSLKNRYLVLNQLGMGGYGVVYKAQDSQFGNRHVAIKEMSQSKLSSQELIEATNAFKQEAFLLASLKHPNLPSIHDHFEEAGRWYLVMDFIEGETLETYLNKANNGKLSIEEVLAIGIQLSTVFHYLHTRRPPIIFRDLKPTNVMRTPDGHLYMIDFGTARLFKPGQVKDTIAFGSVGYAAPEQYGKTQTTPQSDIYSLGAMLHYLLSGHDPSESPFRFAPLQLRGQPNASSLEKLILQMVAADRDKRPANMTTVQQELQSIATHQATGQRGTPQANNLYRNQSSRVSDQHISPSRSTPNTPPPSSLPIQQPTPIKQHHPLRPVLLAGLILLIVGGIILFSFSGITVRYPTTGRDTIVSPYSTIAGSYSGNIHNAISNITTSMNLSINQNAGQASISGFFTVGSDLLGTGPLTGTVSTSGDIQFTVHNDKLSEPILFSGTLPSSNSMSGTYCNVDEQSHCDPQTGNGTWSVNHT